MKQKQFTDAQIVAVYAPDMGTLQSVHWQNWREDFAVGQPRRMGHFNRRLFEHTDPYQRLPAHPPAYQHHFAAHWPYPSGLRLHRW